MFSSSDFINPFSHLPSSSSSTFYHPLPLPPPPFVPQSNPVSNPSEVYPCNYQYHLSCTLDAASPPPVVLVTTHPPLPPEAVWNHGGKDGSVKLKRAAKKDRHSKICTAQGVRDRRVRLSIEIAREFFDLQEMLGFDRASKTLEWLLARSKKDINELALAKRKKQLDAHGPEEQISASTSLSAEKKQRKSTASGCGRADVTVARSARGREVRREQRSKPCCGSNKKKHHDELPSPQMCECEGGGVEDPAAMVRRLNYSKSPNPMISHYNQDSCFYGSPENCFWEPNTGVPGAQAPDGWTTK